MITTWDEINELTKADDDLMVMVTLGYGTVSIIVSSKRDFKYANLRQMDHKYDIEEAIEKTIEEFKKELKGEH